MGELIDIKKDLSTIEAMEEYPSYSNMMPTWEYARDYRPRDSMGRFRRSYDNGSYNYYDDNETSYDNYSSYNRRYSRDDGKTEVLEDLRYKMEHAKNDNERETFKKMMQQIKNM